MPKSNSPRSPKLSPHHGQAITLWCGPSLEVSHIIHRHSSSCFLAISSPCSHRITVSPSHHPHSSASWTDRCKRIRRAWPSPYLMDRGSPQQRQHMIPSGQGISTMQSARLLDVQLGSSSDADSRLSTAKTPRNSEPTNHDSNATSFIPPAHQEASAASMAMTQITTQPAIAAITKIRNNWMTNWISFIPPALLLHPRQLDFAGLV